MASQPRHNHSGRLCVSSTYRSWSHMKSRCNDKNNDRYASYGGRGIKVCDRWNSFENFLADMGERPVNMTIDRINNDGNYEPGNCRWATQREQQRNKQLHRAPDVGVSFHKKSNKRRAIKYGKHLGLFSTKFEAELAYKK